MAKFGSIQVGSASKFSSANQPAVNPFQPDVSQAQLQSPPAPAEYAALKHGPDFEVEFEPNLTPAIDGSRDLLRTLSPFMIQVEPPLVYAGVDQNAKSNLGDILAAGHRSAPSAFQAARNRIQQDIPGGEISSLGGTVEQFIAGGGFNKATGASGIEVKKQGESSTNSGRIGDPAIADVYAAVDITMQLRGLIETPPLILLINPQSLTMSRTKLQNYTDRSRFGFVFQAWGEEQPKLSISAKCGAFISGERGVQWASRRDSSSWQNLANAFRFYRHNGYIYDTVGKSNAHHFVGALSIHYDGWVYYGNMESFNYSYDEGTQLGGVVFEMEFTVNAMVDTSKMSPVVLPMQSPIPSKSDPRYFGETAQALPNSSKDVSVSLDGDVQVGGDTFQSLADVKQGDEFRRQKKAVQDARNQPPPTPQTNIPIRNISGFRPVAQTGIPEDLTLPVIDFTPDPFGQGG